MQTLYAKRMSRKPLQKWALQQLEEKTKKLKKTSNLSDNYHFVSMGHMALTLESGIDVGQGITVGPGKFVKKNKRRALNKCRA